MAARALWKGQLRLSLVSIPVELFSATRSGASVSFRQIHKPSGKPIHYQKVVEGVGPVGVGDIVKYECEDDKYILLDPKEVDSIKLETEKTLKLVQILGVTDISPPVAVEEGERPERHGDNVVDLMAALKKSLEAGEGKKSQPKAQSSSRRGRRKSA
ncbi:hypothetical protein I6F07_05790 [Ensifer sp. IC4062]|nr:hypothetical protein [Ensifer sp. IC4062]